MTNDYKQNALGYLARSVSDPGWDNPAFTFFVGYGCKLDGVEKPNGELAPMERKAAALSKPFVIALDFTLKYYTGQQYHMEDSKWPSYAMDYPLQRLTSIVGSRQFAEIWINFTDPTNHAGEPAGAGWLDFALRMFTSKAMEWAKDNKKELKLRIFTNWQFMETYVANGPAWLHNYRTGIKQDAKKPLDASYPQAEDKPGWLGVKAGGPFWWYADRLVMFDGDEAALRTKLGYGTPTTPPPTDPGTTPGETEGKDLAELRSMVEALTGRVADLDRWRKS